MQEIEYQKSKLKTNLELLKSRQKENKLLTSVVNDYVQYESKLREKEELLKSQQEAYELKMKFIADYIQDLMQTNDLTESGLNKLNYEHSKILKMIDSIKNKIKTI
jgi:hypothetical protein